ncbi:unnamed protein product [Moneuplotes crassus]|uniref:HIT-type domain-containing protein n=1 Tax=Euplotes crassus TaxID=5936 RepID=A0AAD1XY91_EUPCR|nr:unnamed protein product [Moneuplotes crassus]
MEVEKCQICTENEFKYKCPKCAITYCSLVCYKTHQGNEEHKEISLCQQRIEAKRANQPKKKEYYSNDESEEPLFLDDDDVVLTEAELERIKNPQILKMLKNEKIAEFIKRIDSSHNAKKAIEREMEKRENSYYSRFIDELLKSVGYMSEEGRFQIPEK